MSSGTMDITHISIWRSTYCSPTWECWESHVSMFVMLSWTSLSLSIGSLQSDILTPASSIEHWYMTFINNVSITRNIRLHTFYNNFIWKLIINIWEIRLQNLSRICSIKIWCCVQLSYHCITYSTGWVHQLIAGPNG